MIRHDEILATVQALKPLPRTVMDLVAAMSDQDWNIDEICGILTKDPVLAAKVLRLANSPWGGHGNITTLDSAVVRVGASSLVALALGSAVQSDVNRELPTYGVSADQAWRHAVTAMTTAEALRSVNRDAIPRETPTAAILHDIGKVVMEQHFQASDRRYLNQARRVMSLLASEMELYGVHHGEVGALVVRHWKLPPMFAQCLEFHERPDLVPDPEDRLTWAVALADLVAHQIDEAPSPGRDGQMDDAINALGLTRDLVEEARVKAAEQLDFAVGVFA